MESKLGGSGKFVSRRALCGGSNFQSLKLDARLRGRTATQCSNKGSEKVLGRVLGQGSGEGFLTCFTRPFPFCPLRWPPLFLPFSRYIFALSSPLCRAEGTA